MFEATRSNIADRVRRLMPARIARRFARQQDGAAAVEFALVAAPFLALIFAILETAFVFFAGQTLEAAAANSARLIMTGQAQTAGLQPDRLQERSVRAHLSDCSIARTASMSNVKTYSSFALDQHRLRRSPTAISIPRP